ncbi:hypothetical protein AAEO56_19085 [Flavobacterium sp. DGU11]|uniref:Esterase n=1 Tax=Flavobacterium arundinis TaxID=3139143 RepID=A0ABU9I2C6_9FLAO
MRYYITLIFISLCFHAEAQEDYATLTQQALETMWKAKNEADYQEALDMYEKAFKIYPDSIDGTGLYKASVLASELKKYDKAFEYLVPLAKMKTDEDGYPGWSYIVGEYSESEYKNLLSDPRWDMLKLKAIIDKKEFYKELQENEDEFYNVAESHQTKVDKSRILFDEIKNYNPYIEKKHRDYSISFKINDSTKTSFFIHLPKKYNPEKKYALLVFLHGAVRNNALADFQNADSNLGDWNRYYTKYAEQNDVILVFPKGSKQYNWMAPDDGFFMIPEMIKQIKKAININDNKVFISGHSNGATGSFSYLMKQPIQFAGFYGFNTYPKVFTGGTFVENIKNRSFINFSTNEDYYYPPNANDDLAKLMHGINADYKEYRYNGFPHWFPKFDESEPAYQILFNDLINRNRNPFPKEISWEFDDEKYGSIDWLTDIKLDTLKPKANWHQNRNFKINKWLEYDENDSLIIKTVDKNAFDFPRKSGKIKAQYENNIFRIETSRISSFKIYISPEMINLDRKVKIYINGKLYFNKKVKYNAGFMLQSFEQNNDREQIWINCIGLKI